MNANMEGFLDQAEQALSNRDSNRALSEASFLWHILKELNQDRFASVLSPSALFRLARSGWAGDDAATPLFSIVGLPCLSPRTPPLAGDWIVTVMPGIGDVGHVSLLASADLLPRAALRAEGIAAEGDQAGYYGIVIESGVFPHRRDEPFARRILDSRGRLPAHTLILRPSVFVTADDSSYVAPRATRQIETDSAEDDGGLATSASLPSPWPKRLDAQLTEVGARHPLRAALDVVSDTAPFKKIAFAVADLTTSGVRCYAGARDTEQRFIASTGKLAILFAAFQLRKALREAALLVTDARIKKDSEFFATIQRAWRAQIGRYFHGTADSNDSLPALGTMFTAKSRDAGGWSIEFNDGRGGFMERLRGAVLNSDDDDAGACINDLGFPYIHGCLTEAGIWKGGKGLWVALNYAGKWWWPGTVKEVGSSQAASARSLVQLLTLLEFDELVPGSRSEMLDLLSGVRAGKFIGVISYISSGIFDYLPEAAQKTLDIRAKVGYTGDNTHCDAAIVKHSAKAGDLKYTVAILDAFDGDTAEAAAKALDIALKAAVTAAPHESMESQESLESFDPGEDDGAHAGNLEPYRHAVAAQESKFRQALAAGTADAFELALLRVTWQIMQNELTTAPGSVLVFDRLGPDPKFGFTGADRWAAATLQKASEQINPQYASEEQRARKYEEYLNLSMEMLRWGKVKQELIEDKQAGKQYLILGENPMVRQVMQLLSQELLAWFDAQANTKFFMESSARVGLGTMLTERPELSTLLRTAQQLPPDVEVSAIPIDRPAMVEAVELAIGLIPVVGSIVAAYEAWSGVDLFGYHLSDLERGILGASVLLPVAGRLVKGGRALYTEARLVSLYGHDAATWSKTLGAGVRGMAERDALRAVEKAEATLRIEKSVTGAVARDAAGAVPRLTKGVAAAVTPVDQAIVDMLRDLQAAHPQLLGLDALSLERVLAKGPNVDHLKGQLLEELVESRIVPWLSKREGGYALGITVPAGRKLEFIPGHLIRDAAKRQISDGLLVYREGNDLVIAAVFEAKAGKSAARELSLKKGGMSTLTSAERLELRAYAKDVWREERAEAKAAGKAYRRSIEDIESEIMLSELGGQVRRDVERLADGACIRVGTQEFSVRISPTKTKFFGVLPSDVRASTIESQLKDAGYSYEILGVDIKSRALKDIATSLQSLAEKLAEAAENTESIDAEESRFSSVSAGREAEVSPEPVEDSPSAGKVADARASGGPSSRPCCALGQWLFGAPGSLDPKALAGHAYAGGGPVGYVYTARGGIADLGHIRDLADMTKFIYGSLLAGSTTLKLYEGTAILSASPSNPLDLACAMAYVESWAHELTTWATVEDYSAFSPEDLPSNVIGIEIARRAIGSGSAFNAAVDKALSDTLSADLGARPKADTESVFAKIKDNWFEKVVKVPPIALLRRNFDAIPWPAGMSYDAAAPSWLNSARFSSQYSVFSYTINNPVNGKSGVTLATMPEATADIRAKFVSANPGKDRP